MAGRSLHSISVELAGSPPSGTCQKSASLGFWEKLFEVKRHSVHNCPGGARKLLVCRKEPDARGAVHVQEPPRKETRPRKTFCLLR